MYANVLQKMRDAIRAGNFDMTHHANEEMAEDELVLADIESAVLGGRIVRRETDDLRGPKYKVLGPGVDESTEVGVVGRFKETGVLLIITAYDAADEER